MSYELFPLAIAGVIIYSFRDQIKVLVSGDSSTEVKESEYSLEYINPEPVSGATDIHGAEEYRSSSTDLHSEYRFRTNPHQAHGRAFGAELASTQFTNELMLSTGEVAPGQIYQPNADYGPGVHVGYAYNDLTPLTSNGHSTGVSVHAPLAFNPRDYQTISGLTGWPVNSADNRGASRGAYADQFSNMTGFYDVANDVMPEYRFPFPWNPSYAPVGDVPAANYKNIGIM